MKQSVKCEHSNPLCDDCYEEFTGEPRSQRTPKATRDSIDDILNGYTKFVYLSMGGFYATQSKRLNRFEAKEAIESEVLKAQLKEARSVEDYWDGEEFHVDEWQSRIKALKLQIEGKES